MPIHLSVLIFCIVVQARLRRSFFDFLVPILNNAAVANSDANCALAPFAPRKQINAKSLVWTWLLPVIGLKSWWNPGYVLAILWIPPISSIQSRHPWSHKGGMSLRILHSELFCFERLILSDLFIFAVSGTKQETKKFPGTLLFCFESPPTQ